MVTHQSCEERKGTLGLIEKPNETHIGSGWFKWPKRFKENNKKKRRKKKKTIPSHFMVAVEPQNLKHPTFGTTGLAPRHRVVTQRFDPGILLPKDSILLALSFHQKNQNYPVLDRKNSEKKNMSSRFKKCRDHQVEDAWSCYSCYSF